MRRIIVALFALILLSTGSQAFLKRAPYVDPAPTGRAQIGLWFPNANLDFPLINTFRMTDSLWYAPFGSVEDIQTLMNADGYPTRMPSDNARMDNIAYGREVNDTCTPSGNPNCWVLTWDGTATVRASLTAGFTTLFSLTQNIINSNRVEYSISSASQPVNTPFQVQLAVTAITPASGFGNIKFYRGGYESRVAAGEKYDPEFKTVVGQFGRARYMDWLATNGSPQRAWSSRVTQNQLSWTGVNISPSNYVGVVSLSNNAYTASGTISGNPTVWTDGMFVEAKIPGPIVYKDVTGFCTTAGCNNPARVTATAHGFSTGNSVIFSSNSIVGGTIATNTNLARYTITVVDANTFTLDGVNSSTWGTYTSGGKVGIAPTFATSTLPAKPIIQDTLDTPSFSGYPNVANSIVRYTYEPAADAVIYNTIQLNTTSALNSNGSGFKSGFPYESIIEISNETNTHPWINLPVRANDDYFTQFGGLLCGGTLNAQLVPIVGYGNEIWNSGFSATAYANRRAGLAGWSADYNLWYGVRFYEGMTLVKSACGSRPINRAMEMFTATYTTGQVTNRFTAPGTGVAAFPCTVMDSVAIAPYFESQRTRTTNAQYVWQMLYGDAGQQAAAMTWIENFLRDDGWVGTGSINGTTLTITGTTSGELVSGHVIYGTGIPGPPSANPVTISGAGPTTYTLSSNLGVLSDRALNTGSASYTVKWLRDVVYPSWKTIADGSVSGCPAAALTWYEGGWGYQATPLNNVFINPITASSYNGRTFYNQTTPVGIVGAANNGSGNVRLTCTGTNCTANLISGQQYYIRGVQGTTEANGVRTVTVISGTTFDIDVAFTNAYLTGSNSGVVVVDAMEFYYRFYNSSNFAGIFTDNFNNFVSAGGVYPAAYTFTSNWQMDYRTGYSLNQGSGLIHPTIFGDQMPAYQSLQNFNANWLLKRDMQTPGSANDNSPMWLEKAA